MIFSVSTLCTHIMLCGAMLFILKKTLQQPARLGRFGFGCLLFSLVLLAVRLLLPFEWGVTKTILVSHIYPSVIYFLNKPFPLLNLTIFQFLLGAVVLVSTVQTARLLLIQQRYTKYLHSLPTFMELTVANRRGYARKVRVVKDPASANALVSGFIKPQIVLPALSLTDEEAQLILQHELFHVKAGDVAIKFLVEIACAIYWWVPFIGALRQQTSAALELRADASVTKKLGEHGKIHYLECLLKVAKAVREEKTAFSVGFAAAKASPLKARFLNVASPSKPKPLYQALSLVFALLVLLSSLVVFEPYCTSAEIFAGTFRLVEGKTFFVPRGNEGYDLYVEGECKGRLTDIPKSLSALPVIENLKEAEP